MNNDQTVKGTMITYRGSEWTPDYVTEYVHFSACVNYQGFSGATEFEATSEQITSFVQELSGFYEKLTGTAELTTGWGEDIYFNLKLTPHESRGDVLLNCTLRQPSTDDLYNKVHIYYVVEPQQVDELLRFFQIILALKEPQSTCLLPKNR